jgi:hypothetical protein
MQASTRGTTSRWIQHRRGAGEGLGTELLDQPTDLERDDGTERDGDERRGHDRHRGDEPGLLDELAQLEGSAEQRAPDVEREGKELACGPDRGECPGSSQ